MCTYIEKVQKFSRVMEWDTVEIDNMVDPMIEFVRGALNILKINEQILTKEQMISLFNQINNKNFSVIKENEFLLNYNFEQKQAFKHIEKTSRYPQESWKNLPFALRVAVFYCFCRYYEQEKKSQRYKKEETVSSILLKINKKINLPLLNSVLLKMENCALVTSQTVSSILSEVKDGKGRNNLIFNLLRVLFYNNPEEYIEYDNGLSLTFFTLLWKSLLLGEFYSETNYCGNLQSPTDCNKSNYKINDDESIPFRPSVGKNYEIVKNDLQEFCDKISIEDRKERKSKSTVITLDILSSRRPEKQDGRLFDALRNLTLLILEMIRLDLYYVTTVENVKKLGVLYEKLKNLQEAIDRTSFFDGVKIPLNYDPEERQKTQDVIEALMFKTKRLADRMLGQQVPEIEKDIAYRYKFLKDPFMDAVKIIYMPEKDNGYWMYLTTRDGKDVDGNYNNDYFELEETNFVDKYLKNIEQNQSEYNNHINKGQALHFENQTLFKKCKDKKLSDKDIADYLDKTKNYSVEKWNPALLVKLAQYISNEYSVKEGGEQKITIEALESLHRILQQLKEIVFKYQRDDFSAPLCFRPLFEYSFLYKQGDKESTDKIFFASFLSQPVNIVFLDRFCMKYEHRYNEMLRKTLSDMKNSFSETQKKIENSKKALTEAQEKIEKSQKAFSKTKKELDSISEDVKEERSRTLQLLGILGAFIAFASSIVGLYKVVSSLEGFILFAATYVGCILVFVWCIFKVSNLGKEDAEKNSTLRNAIKWSVFIIFILLVIYSAYSLFKKNEENPSISQEAEQCANEIQSSKSEQQDMNGIPLRQVTDTLPKTKSDSSVLLLPSSAK